MYLTMQALVLRVTDYNDKDALLTVLTRNYGKLTIKARGLRRKNSPLIAPCQLLSFAEFTVFEYRGMYTINEGHSLELFQGLRRDLQKLSLGTYFAQVAELISQEDLPNPELLALTLRLRSLHAQYYGTEEAVSDEMAAAFLKEELDRAGAEEMITPREIIRDFVTLLDLLYQNPGATFEDMMRKAEAAPVNPDPDGENAVGGEESSAIPTPPVRVELSDIEL